MDSKNINKALKQGVTATQLADILEAGSSSNEGVIPKQRQGSPTKTSSQGTAKSGNARSQMARLDPRDLKNFRPPLGRSVANTTTPQTGKREGKTRYPKAEKGSPYYVPTSADFGDDLPGGKKDKNLRQLSGAQTKWYRRALLEGDNPETALLKAKQRGHTQATQKEAAPKTDAGKRGLSTDSQSPDIQPSKYSKTSTGSTELRKPVHKPHKPPRHEPAEGSFGMAILDSHYPSSLMTEAEMRDVESFLIGKVIEGWTTKIRIHNLKLGPGYINLTVEDSQTATWLRQMVWSMNITLKKNLKVVEGAEIPQARLITMFLPRAGKMTRENILKAIRSSNDLETDRWQVVSDDTTKDKEGREIGKTLKALIDEDQQKKLADMKHVIHFIFGQVSVYGARSATPKGQNTHTSTGLAPKEGVPSEGKDTAPELAMTSVEAGPEIEMDSGNAKGEEDITPEEENFLLNEAAGVTEEPEGTEPQ